MFSRERGLPDELVLHLFRFFQRKELNTLAQVNKRFNAIAYEDSLHKRKYFPLPDYLNIKEIREIPSQADILLAILTYYGEKLFLTYGPAGIGILDLKTEVITTLPCRKPYAAAACALSATKIVTGHGDGSLTLWDTDHHTSTDLYQFNDAITHLMQWNDTELIVATSSDHTVQNNHKSSLYKFDITTKNFILLMEVENRFTLLNKLGVNTFIYVHHYVTYIFDVKENKCLRTISNSYHIAVLSKTEEKFVVCDTLGKVWIYHKNQHSNQYEPLMDCIDLHNLGFGSCVTCIAALSEDSFAIGLHDVLMVVDVREGMKYYTLKIKFFLDAMFGDGNGSSGSESIVALTLLPDKTKLAAITNLNEIKILDLEKRTVTKILNSNSSKRQYCQQRLIIQEDHNLIFIEDGICKKITFKTRPEVEEQATLGKCVTM